MFCPSCRAEYKEGITVCPDCGTALAAKLPPETDIPGPVTVLETRNLALVELAKSMLDEAGISFLAKGELTMENLSLGPVEIQVSADDEEEAKEILSGLESGQSAESFDMDDFEGTGGDEEEVK